MATDRLYIVNTETKEYCCVAKSFDGGWNFGNAHILDALLINTIPNQTKNIIIGSENDNEFYEKWIKPGINMNTTNEWKYY